MFAPACSSPPPPARRDQYPLTFKDDWCWRHVCPFSQPNRRPSCIGGLCPFPLPHCRKSCVLSCNLRPSVSSLAAALPSRGPFACLAVPVVLTIAITCGTPYVADLSPCSAVHLSGWMRDIADAHRAGLIAHLLHALSDCRIRFVSVRVARKVPLQFDRSYVHHDSPLGIVGQRLSSGSPILAAGDFLPFSR